jgi:hypothetical protein
MRPSSTTTRPSHAGFGGSQSTSSGQRLLAQKKNELEGVTALEAASEVLLKRVKALCEDSDAMADSGAGNIAFSTRRSQPNFEYLNSQ